MWIENGTYLMDGRFVRRGGLRLTDTFDMEACAPGPGEQVLNATGCYVLPGLIDLHIHGYGGHDMMEGEAGTRAMAELLPRHGVTGFLPATVCAPIDATNRAVRGVQACMDAPPRGARILGCHLEAPFLNVSKKGAQDARYMLLPSMEAYEALTEGARDCVRLLTLAPELEGAQALIRALSALGVRTACAHSEASAELVHEAAGWGLTQITHLFNAQTPLHHREPGVPGAGLADPRIAVQVIADGIHLHPDILRIAAAAKGRKGCLLITDAMMAAGLADGVFSLGALEVIVKDGAARLPEGNLAGSTLTMDEAVRNMIAFGVSREDAVYMASTAPADAMGMARMGRIASGCMADCYVADEAFRPLATVVGGEVVWKRS